MKKIFKIEIDSRRIFGLDLLRAFAIMFVLIDHSSFLLPPDLKFIPKLFVLDGVTIFFVLSGFLIGGILIKIVEEKGFSIHVLKDFWVRRWFRTLPNYFLILTILCILSLIYKEDFSFEVVKKYYYFSQNLFNAHPLFFPEAWSLSVEEWFYLILPLVLGFFTLIFSTKKRAIFVTCLLVILIITLFRYYRFLNVKIDDINDWDLIFRKQVFTRLDSLMFGVTGAYLNFYHNKYWLRNKLLFFIIGVFLLLISKFVLSEFFIVNGLFSCVFSFSVISVGTFLLLPFLSQYRSERGIIVQVVTYISLISYSMYLINLSLVQNEILVRIDWLMIYNNEYIMGSIRYICYWTLVISISILLYKYFELPMTSLRDKKIKLK